MNNKILLLILLFCNIDGYCFAQQTTAHQDSAKFYRDIQDLSKRSKITKLIHRVFFKPIETPPPKPTISKRKNKVVKLTYYAKAEGKIIRDIVITTLDPFGYNVNDTAVAPRSFVQSTGNFLHIKTQRMAIKNLLLIRKNRPLDSLLIRESERLIRAQKYVRDVVVYASPVGNKSDSVDVFIRVLDAWSIDIALGASTTQQVSNLTDKDFGGLGHQFSNKYKWKYDGRYYYETNYLVPNIKKSYISVAGSYIKDEKKFETTSLDFERPFYSPFTKWAGGSYFAWHWYYDSLHLNDNTNRLQHFKSFTQDYWLGRAVPVFKGRSETDRTTNLILSGRFYTTHFLERPGIDFDTAHAYSNDKTFLVSAGVSARKYRQDKYLFNYGITEDVPVGKAFAITVGPIIKNNIARWYYGGRISFGSYYSWGYFGTDLEYGTFANGGKFHQGTFFGELNYFTGLFELGRWKLRQFIKPQLTLGFSRSPSDRLTFTNDYGIRGFSNDSIAGTQRLLILLQTQSYAPWNILGFRFGPYFICALGMLGDEQTGFRKSKMYAQFGLGVLIKNEFLVLNTFQFSIAFYPLIPGAGSNIF